MRQKDVTLALMKKPRSKIFYLDATRRDVLKLGGLGLAGLCLGTLGCSVDASLDPNNPYKQPGEDAGMDAGLAYPEDAAALDDASSDSDDPNAQIEDGGQADAAQQSSSPQPFVLLQFSDMHIGAQPFATSALRLVVRELIPIVNPDLSLFTGDLVDHGNVDSQWDDYTSILNNAGLDFSTIYEQAGNHDAKSDPDLTRFLNRSVTGLHEGICYGYRDLLVDGRRLRLISINTASGGSWAKNLPGFLDPDQVDDLIAQLEDDSHIPDATFILGHHPVKGFGNSLSTTFTDDDQQRLVTASDADAYLFGHVHKFKLSWQQNCLNVQASTLGNPSTLTPTPGFCLMTFDQGLAVQNINLIKNDHDNAELDWPIVQIIHPVDAALGENNPRANSLAANSESELRALICAPEPPDEVSFRVDAGAWQPMTAEPSRADLYRANWLSPQANHCILEVRCRAMGHTRSHKIEIRLS